VYFYTYYRRALEIRTLQREIGVGLLPTLNWRAMGPSFGKDHRFLWRRDQMSFFAFLLPRSVVDWEPPFFAGSSIPWALCSILPRKFAALE
jgi:hypothetical protein